MGFRNKQIAYILSVSKSTVKKTLENVFQKLSAKDRANAVMLGFIHGFLNVEILNDINSKFKHKIKNIPNNRQKHLTKQFTGLFCSAECPQFRFLDFLFRASGSLHFIAAHLCPHLFEFHSTEIRFLNFSLNIVLFTG